MSDEKEFDEKDRHPRHDRDSEKALGAEGSVSGQGRSGGRLARKVGTRDELKRAFERPAGASRVTKSDEDQD